LRCRATSSGSGSCLSTAASTRRTASSTSGEQLCGWGGGVGERRERAVS
jgi:hypothetical protein